MDQENDFHQLMAWFWKCIDLDLPRGQKNDVYTMTFDNQVDVHFLGTMPGKIDVIAEAGILNNKRSGQTLLDLLELNHPPYNINVDQDSGAVMVWTRQDLAVLDCTQLVDIVSNLMARVQQAKQCIGYRDEQSIFSSGARHHRLRPVESGKKHVESGARN